MNPAIAAMAAVILVGNAVDTVPHSSDITLRLRFCTPSGHCKAVSVLGEDGQYADLDACLKAAAGAADTFLAAVPDAGHWAGASCTIASAAMEPKQAEPEPEIPRGNMPIVPPDKPSERRI